MTSNYQAVLADLMQTTPVNIDELPPPFAEEVSLEHKFCLAHHALLRASRLNNRILMLMNAYYMGKLIEKEIDDPHIRRLYANKLTPYYRVVTSRLYYLYEYSGPRQLTRSTQITLSTIRRLTAEEFLSLHVEALSIFQRG